MKKTSKILSFILAILMVISIVPITASAATSGTCGDNLTWVFDDSTKTLTISGTGAMDDYDYRNIPWKEYEYSIENVFINDGVTEICVGAFTSSTIIKSIVVDEKNQYYSSDKYGVLFNKDKTTIIKYPQGDTRINYIIPDSVTTIGAKAFYNSYYLKNVVIRNNVVTIEDYAFNGPMLNQVRLGNSVTTIGKHAFDSRYITSVVIPNSVTTIGENAFSDNCYNLKDVYYTGTEEEWQSILINSSNKYLLNATIHYDFESVQKITGACGDNLTWEYDWLTYSLIISGTGDMYSNIPWKAYKEQIINVVIKDDVTSICNSAFSGCTYLTNVAISESVTIVGDYAFSGCENITGITIPDSVTTMGSGVFSNCTSLTSVTIPDGVTTIGSEAFFGCSSLTSVTIPDSITAIGFMAFENCGIKDVYYIGTEEEWNNISIDEMNYSLHYATIHYNYVPPFTGIKDNHFYKDDVMQKAYQLVEFEGDFYYIGDRHEIVKNKKVYIKEDRLNGLTYADSTPITAGWYEFDENGKMVILNGVVGNKIYKNNTMLKAYQLVEVDGDFYYIGDRHEIVKNKKVYIKADRLNGLTYSDGTPLIAGWYQFDANGKMVILNGLVGDNIYKNNVQLKAYQLVEVDGDFYYIGDRHQIIKDKKVYIKAERLNGLTYPDGTPLTASYYTFDADGEMIIE